MRPVRLARQREELWAIRHRRELLAYARIPSPLTRESVMPSIDQIVEAVESGEYLGFCLECGAEHDGCEPDAREYECRECGARAVYGAEECLLMGVGENP